MEWLDLVPGYSAYKLLTKPIKGEKLSDYANCAPTVEKCEASEAVAKLECWNCIRAIMIDALKEILPLAGVSIAKGAGGIVLRQLAKSLAKAAAEKGAKSLGASILGPIGVGIAVLSAADALTAIYKAVDIINTGFKARDHYCKCGTS